MTAMSHSAHKLVHNYLLVVLFLFEPNAPPLRAGRAYRFPHLIRFLALGLLSLLRPQIQFFAVSHMLTADSFRRPEYFYFLWISRPIRVYL